MGGSVDLYIFYLVEVEVGGVIVFVMLIEVFY